MKMHHSHLRPDGTTWPPVTPDPPPPPGYVDPLAALEDPTDPAKDRGGATVDTASEPAEQERADSA